MTPEPEPPQVTRRWYSAEPLSYVLALIELMEYARSHRGDFAAYPGTLDELRQNGLSVCGPKDVLDAVAELLARIEGLAEEDALARFALRDVGGPRG